MACRRSARQHELSTAIVAHPRAIPVEGRNGWCSPAWRSFSSWSFWTVEAGIQHSNLDDADMRDAEPATGSRQDSSSGSRDGLRVGYFALGITSGVSLSPLSAISDMVAPVVLITVAAFIGNGMGASAVTLSGWVLALERERIGILRGPHGEKLDEGSMPPLDRERLSQISDQIARTTTRIAVSRRAVLFTEIAIGLLVLSVAAIAVAATARSEAFAFTALALVIAGVVVVFAAVASVIFPTARPADAVIPPSRRNGEPG